MWACFVFVTIKWVPLKQIDCKINNMKWLEIPAAAVRDAEFILFSHGDDGNRCPSDSQ